MGLRKDRSSAGAPNTVRCIGRWVKAKRRARLYSQRRRPARTPADAVRSPPTEIDRCRPQALNSKTEGRGFESFRPCHGFGRRLYSGSPVDGPFEGTPAPTGYRRLYSQQTPKTLSCLDGHRTAVVGLCELVARHPRLSVVRTDDARGRTVRLPAENRILSSPAKLSTCRKCKARVAILLAAPQSLSRRPRASPTSGGLSPSCDSIQNDLEPSWIGGDKGLAPEPRDMRRGAHTS
jgi:hypothetical protein